MNLLDIAAVGLKEPLAITWSGLFIDCTTTSACSETCQNCTFDMSNHKKVTRLEWSKSPIIPVLQGSMFLSETFQMFFQCSLTSTACALFVWTPWITQNNKYACLEMHLGQVVCLLHLRVLIPFYHHVEMAKGGGLRCPIISLNLAYLEHVAVSAKRKNCCTQL